MTRALDGGWLPIPVITKTKDGLIIIQRSFVAPIDDPGENPARLNRPSIFVSGFVVTNTLDKPADVSLSLNFLLNVRKKKPAGLSPAPLGWVVQGDSGQAGLVATSNLASFLKPPRPATASLFAPTGKLPPPPDRLVCGVSASPTNGHGVAA